MDIYVELAFIMAKQAEKPLSELINSLKYEGLSCMGGRFRGNGHHFKGN